MNECFGFLSHCNCAVRYHTREDEHGRQVDTSCVRIYGSARVLTWMKKQDDKLEI